MKFKKELIREFVPESPYDLVFSNSLLHHLHDPFEFWGQYKGPFIQIVLFLFLI